MLASGAFGALGTTAHRASAWPHRLQQQQQHQQHRHRRRRTSPSLPATPTPTPTRRRPGLLPTTTTTAATTTSSATSSFASDASADDTSSADAPPAPGARPTTPPLSARALELAAEAAATSAAAALVVRGRDGGRARTPPGYRFAAACISSFSATDEAVAVCPVEDMDDDEDEDGGARPAATRRLPPSMSPLSSVHLDPDQEQQQPEQQRQQQPKQQQQQQQQLRPRQRALLQWAAGGPRRCLIVKKAGAAEPRRKMVEIANWLADRGVACFVERAVHASELPGLPPFDPRSTAVDFAITLGGDGTVLHLASMFEGGDTPLPPVVCFAMGTLGFLTAFSADDFEACLERVLAGDRHPLYCTLRSRTRVDVLLPVGDEGDGNGDEARDGEEGSGANGDGPLAGGGDDGEEGQEGGGGGGDGASPIPASSPENHDDANGRLRRRRRRPPAVRLSSTRHVLNECVVDRGAFPHAVYIEIFVDGAFVTAAEADGLVVATPSGSTAYSMSAGGPMVSPSVPCTLLTPLSPQSLSFRPLVIPGSSELLISIPRYARSHARLSFDGRSGRRLPRGSALRVTTSSCPLPFINLKPLDGDFYEAIVEKLRWNTLIRGRAGERPVPPAVLGPVDEEEEGDIGGGGAREGALASSPATPPASSSPSLAPAA